ncbi:hypothetical protein KBC79_02070, partial [Candidatus Woesebacteria bacterium]|nr:hypothetical protein [Candidatus Woesebacteria bacterium]
MRFISSIFRFQAKYLFVLLLFAVALATQQWSNIIKVLGVGQSAPQFFVSADKEGQQRGGLIALSSADEPAVELTSWQTEGVAEVTLYPINREQLLTYLLHTDDSSQVSRGFDTSSLEKVATLEHTVSRYSENPNKLVLPLTSTGMWYMQIRIGDVLDDVVIVRSRIGGVAKEHDQGLLVWGQHFETKRHLEEGTVTLYSLMNTVQVVGSGSLGSDGIATLPLPVKTDIAVLSTGDDFAVIPVNLEHLNVGYSYNRFVSSERKHSYFVFVDRPLYKPGDTLYYKAMIRDDNDARYSVAQGSALVQIYKSGNELETIYERTVPLSSLGSFDGVFNLPDTASPGQYTLKIRHASDTEDSWIWESMAQFQVDYFRKPEYSLEVGATNQTVVQGEGGEFILTGEYFSGQSLAGEDVSYTAYASSIYEYEYAQTWLEESIDTQYNYGLWSGDRVATGTVTLDSYGKAQVPLKELNIPASGSLRVITLEASYMDDSGNPVLARKNIILYPGNLSIYRAQGPYSGKVNQKYTLPIFLTARNSDSVARKPITATVTRRYWESQMVSGQKYPVYTYKDESLPEIQSQTDDQGKADLQVIPQKEGSYTVSVSVHDSERNVITKSFNFWINEYGSPWIMGQGEDQLTLSLDRATYDPGDEATVEIYSAIPDRDILVTVQRARVHRYVLVSLTGNFATIKLPIVDSDIPNVIVRANSFSTGAMQSATAPLTVARDSKRVAVTITSDKKVYGPGETVTLDIQTKDTTGDGVAAEVAVWSVDKALFELVDDTRKNIFEVFWAQRSDTTQESHSLKGINVQTAEKGGGCFVAGTAVTMADGSKRPIELVKVGESVLTRTSEQDAKLVSARVVGTHSVQESGYLILNGELQLTANHLIWVNDRWMEAGSVQVGDVLLDSDGKEVVVETVEWQQKAVTVYNLSVESQETFFAENIWVHNQKGSARTVFKDTAYWNPTVRTGIDGTARVQFKLPDNLTTWVIAGVAANERTQVGQTLSEIKVSKSLVVRPILPNIIRVGDELHASALINNFTGVEQKLDVDLTFSAGEVEQATHSAVTVIPNKPLQLAWKLKADREQSEAQITIAARGGSQDASDTVTTTMPVISYGFFEKSAGVGNGPATFPLSIPEDADPKHSNVRVALPPTMLGTLPTAMKYLIQYP